MLSFDKMVDFSRVGLNREHSEDIDAMSFKPLYYRIIKRTFDFSASLAALIVLSPLFIIVALLIYIDDPNGSPFFCQNRVGKNGKIFKMYKFRSMVCDAEDLLKDLQKDNEKDGAAFKIKDDPRITRIGRFIRKTSIDELPQLINILKGDMSVVGPRPPLPTEVDNYKTRYRKRLRVRPGLTCYWQASDNRDDISFDDWMEMDMKYIKECNIWADIKIILRTVKVVLTAQGN